MTCMTAEQLVSNLPEMLAIAVAAGAEIMTVFASPLDVASKGDGSPVTLADARAEKLICERLSRLCPGIPIVAEEQAASGILPPVLGDLFILVDPLDGTREFIEGRPDFTVNIAVISGDQPVLGVVYAPAQRRIFWGTAEGAFCGQAMPEAGSAVADVSRLAVRPRPLRAVVVASRSHGNEATRRYIEGLGPVDLLAAGSSLKFCRVATGEADLYPRFGRTMEWDTAAGQAVLVAAGGAVLALDGRPLRYGKRDQSGDGDFANPHFIASGGQAAEPATAL